jgi:hypothetical protein
MSEQWRLDNNGTGETVSIYEDADRWIVVPVDHALWHWAVRDQAGELGDLLQRHRWRADGIARVRNQRMPWPEGRREAKMTSEQDIHGVAERLARACEKYVAEHGNPRVAPNLYTDALTVARYVLAARATDRAAELEALIERTIFALSLGGNGTIDEAERVQRDHGNQLANLYLDLCAARGRGHRAALSGSSAEGDS